MAAKLCKKQQKSFDNNVKYSDFIDGKYFLRNKPLKGPYCSKKIASKLPRDILKMSMNKSFYFRARFRAIYSTSKTKKYLLKAFKE